MTREEFIKQRCEIDKITEEEFEKRYRVVKCNCGQPYCKGNRCLDLDDLLKENQKLKKQLDKAHDELYTFKNKNNIRLLNQISENIEPDCEDYYLAEIETKAHKYDLIQNQQKEFIDYMNKTIEELECDDVDDEEMKGYLIQIIDTFKEILRKYKIIIGDDK